MINSPLTPVPKRKIKSIVCGRNILLIHDLKMRTSGPGNPPVVELSSSLSFVSFRRAANSPRRNVGRFIYHRHL